MSNFTNVTDLQNNTNQVNWQNQRKNLGTGKIDRQGFIQLMLAQLQYQDPTNPADNSQMLTQQVMLEQADQMNSLVQSNQFSQASTLVGKNVDLVGAKWDPENGVSLPVEYELETGQPKIINGTVESVQYDYARGKALLKVDGDYYELSNLRQVNDVPIASTTP